MQENIRQRRTSTPVAVPTSYRQSQHNTAEPPHAVRPYSPSIRRGIVTVIALLLLITAFTIVVGERGSPWLRLFPVLVILAIVAEHRFVYRPLAKQLNKLQEELRSAERLDPLTGCLNRRAFVQETGRVFARARRYDSPVAVLMIDADHFKQVNDQCGQATGDLVICSLAGVLLRNIREIDILARMGGEEFTILLPDSGLVAAMLVAQRVRRLIAAGLVHSTDQGEPISITASIGVAVLHDTDLTLFDALDRADRALSRAKQNGRDRVESEESAPTPSRFNNPVRTEPATTARH